MPLYEKIMLKTSLPPHTVRVANDFFKDGAELLSRFKAIFEKCFAIKSWRMKCFIDLRMSCECFLKAIRVYHENPELDRKAAIKKVESYGHKVTELARDSSSHLSPELWKELKPYTEALVTLPVGLRYALDGYDFISAREDDYYATIGSDGWMDGFAKVLEKVKNEINEELQGHSGIYGMAALKEEILNPPFNKYRK